VQELQGHAYVFFSILFISLIIAITQRLKKISAEKMETELQFLKAQVNPHFLFNSLNSIYSLSLIKSDKTPTAVLKLSEMMRYVTDESKNEFVSMEKEIKYIDNYVELQNLRLPSATKLEYRTDIKTSYKQIAPLILIHFVENAFKHGLSASTPSTIQIDIFTTEDELSLYTANPKHNRQKPTQKEDGIGLQNTINRLEFLYPNNHTLTINDTPNNYFVTLKMNLI
jgi:LytS/YehU family sensor histidine kinase